MAKKETPKERPAEYLTVEQLVERLAPPKMPPKPAPTPTPTPDAVPKEPTGMAKGGSVSSASKRADGCAQRGKTKGKMR